MKAAQRPRRALAARHRKREREGRTVARDCPLVAAAAEVVVVVVVVAVVTVSLCFRAREWRCDGLLRGLGICAVELPLRAPPSRMQFGHIDGAHGPC